MALSKFGFIVTGKDLNPARHRMVMDTGSFKMIAVGVSDPGEGIAVARSLFEEGIQLLELCGGFDAKRTAAVLEAVEYRIPVGVVSYGPESIDGMHALFSTMVSPSAK